MNSILFSSFTHWQILRYALVFMGMMIEGDIFLFTASFLAHQGFFDIGVLAILALVGALIGDSLWYLAGRLLENHINNSSRISFVTRWTAKMAAPLDFHLLNQSGRTIFVSKFVYGFHHILIARLGMLFFPWYKFIKIDFISVLLWGLIVAGLGYFSGTVSFALRQYLRFAEMGLLIMLVAFLAIEYLVIKKLKL